MATWSEVKQRFTDQEFSNILARLGIGTVFVLFGAWELINPVYWQAYAPGFLQGGYVLTLVKLHGVLLLVTGVGVNLERYRKEFAGLGVLIMLEILFSVFLEGGFNSILLRDLGLLMLALSVLYQDQR
ncbi:MAG: hypothetical protein ABEJ99_04815 [Candidatus Nanohaloarchaea archaeon]